MPPMTAAPTVAASSGRNTIRASRGRMPRIAASSTKAITT
jgi:hypothetical protein